MDDLIAALQEAPEDTPLSPEKESALVELLADYHAGESFFFTLPAHSPQKARAVLAHMSPQIPQGYIPPFDKAIDQAEQATEVAALHALSDDELEARINLLALMSPDSHLTWRRARPMAVVLAQRNPTRLMELSSNPTAAEGDLWVRLRSEQFLYYSLPTNPQRDPALAFQLLADGLDARRWFTAILDKTELTLEFRRKVFDRMMELAPTMTELPMQKLFKELIENMAERGQAAERLALLQALVPHAELLPPPFRPDLIKWLLQATRTLERGER